MKAKVYRAHKTHNVVLITTPPYLNLIDENSEACVSDPQLLTRAETPVEQCFSALYNAVLSSSDVLLMEYCTWLWQTLKSLLSVKLFVLMLSEEGSSIYLQPNSCLIN